MFTKTRSAFLTLLSLLTAPLCVDAQGLESLGNRAAGMAAFVAVADDASAVAWNPAGLVGGPIFNIALDLGRTTSAPGEVPDYPAAAGRLGSTLIALGTTPVGLAYYRLTTTTITANPAVMGSGSREDRQVVGRTLVTSHIGATVQQSLGDYLTLGATVRLVRGSVGGGSATVSTWNEAFEQTDEFDTDGSTTGDLDVGVMYAAGRVRAGLVVRNLTAPTFGDDDGPVGQLDRQARVGVAWGSRWPGISPLVVSVDADFTRVPHPAGERRDVAAGVERWLRGQQFGVRGGIRASTVGDARPVASGGVSYAIRTGVYVDAFVMSGRDTRGWGVAARVSY